MSTKNIIYLNSYNIGYPWTDEVTKGFTSVLDSTIGINYYAEFMDTKRFMNNLTFKHTYEALYKKYTQINFDVIVASDNNAVDFFIAYKDSSLFKNKPFVFAGISNIKDYNFNNIDAYGIKEAEEINQLFYSMYRLFPDRNRLHVFIGRSRTASIHQQLIKDFEKEYQKETIQIIETHNNDSIISTLKSLGENDIAYLFNTHYDSTGTFKPYHRILSDLDTSLEVPVFSNMDNGDHGIVGGISDKGIIHGKLMAQTVLKIINNEIINPRIITPSVELQYNYPELKRFKVDFSLLPRDAVIINQPETFFSKIKKMFYLNLLFILSSIAIILILIYSNYNLRKYRFKLEDARDKAMQSESVKSSFIANVSHEIRTPLNAIIGFSDILLLENKDETLHEYIKHVHNSSQILVRLVNDVLDLSLIDANEVKLNYSLVHLPSLMDEIIQRNMVQLDQIKKPKLRLKLKKSDHEPEDFYTDQLRLNQVIQNLISNAIKFSVKGTITISYQFINKEEIEDIAIASNFSLSHNQYCMISVKDYGIGIPQELKNFVFERFRRLDQVYLGHHGGVGLGLNISKSIINLMGGEIWFTSEQSRGSVFSFILPHTPSEL